MLLISFDWLVQSRGRKLINKLVINKLEKYKFFHVGKNISHPRKSEKIRENLYGQMIIFPHASHHFHVIFSTGSGLWEHFEGKKRGKVAVETKTKTAKKFKSSNVTTLRYHAESQHRIVIPKLFSKPKASEKATLASEKAAWSSC